MRILLGSLTLTFLKIFIRVRSELFFLSNLICIFVVYICIYAATD